VRIMEALENLSPKELEKKADELLAGVLKKKVKPEMEYPFKSHSQIKRMNRKEIPFGGSEDMDQAPVGQFYRIHPTKGRSFSNKPRGKRKYFYTP